MDGGVEKVLAVKEACAWVIYYEGAFAHQQLHKSWWKRHLYLCQGNPRWPGFLFHCSFHLPSHPLRDNPTSSTCSDVDVFVLCFVGFCFVWYLTLNLVPMGNPIRSARLPIALLLGSLVHTRWKPKEKESFNNFLLWPPPPCPARGISTLQAPAPVEGSWRELCNFGHS